jgi:hypothetical protein
VSPAVRHYRKQVAPLLSHAPLRCMSLTGKSCESVDAPKMRLVLRMVQLRCTSLSVAFAPGSLTTSLLIERQVYLSYAVHLITAVCTVRDPPAPSMHASLTEKFFCASVSVLDGVAAVQLNCKQLQGANLTSRRCQMARKAVFTMSFWIHKMFQVREKHRGCARCLCNCNCQIYVKMGRVILEWLRHLCIFPGKQEIL